MGKVFPIQFPGHAAIKADYTLRHLQADIIFMAMSQARVDSSVGRIFRSFLVPALLVISDPASIASPSSSRTTPDGSKSDATGYPVS